MAGVPFDPDVPRPFSQRADCMYLDTLHKKDLLACQVQDKGHERDVPTGLLTQDIFKANPYYSHKEFFTNQPWRKEQVPGSHPATHYRLRNRAVDLTLVCGDVEFAQPHSIAFDTSRRTDPLVPRYRLPKCEPLPQDPPRVPPKDTMRTDINIGLPKREPLWTRMIPREKNDCSDVEFALPNYHRRVIRPLPPPEKCRNPLRTDDINDRRIMPGLGVSPRAPRATQQGAGENPLDPVYKIAQGTTHPFYGGDAEKDPEEATIGPVAGASARKIIRDNGEPGMSLFCKDIPGASSQRYKGQKPFNLYDPPEVTPIVFFHDPADIDGADAGSMLRRHGAAAVMYRRSKQNAGNGALTVR